MSVSEASGSPADRARIADVPRNNRSAVSNGSRVAVGIDLRTREGRRWRDCYADAMRQTGGRNETLCKQLASLIVQRERLDSMLARGEPVDTQDLIRLAGAVSRTMTKLGIVEEAPPPLVPHDAPAFVIGPREAAP